MAEPKVMVEESEDPQEDEIGVIDLQVGKLGQCFQIEQIETHRKQYYLEWESFKEPEQYEDGNDGVDQLHEGSFGELGVLFDQLGQVVEPAGDSQCKADEAGKNADEGQQV